MAVIWEAVFLHALDQVVPIRLEVALSNGRQPDFGLNSIAKEQDCRSSVTSRACRMWAWTGRIRSQNSAVKSVGWRASIGCSPIIFGMTSPEKRSGKIRNSEASGLGVPDKGLLENPFGLRPHQAIVRLSEIDAYATGKTPC